MNHANCPGTKLSRLALAAVLSMGMVPAYADHDGDAARPTFSINGFGTLGAVYHREPGIQFRRDISQGHGAAPGKLSFTPDSLLGVQATAALGSNIDVTVQAVSHLNIDNDYRPEIAWGFVKYTGDDGFNLRAGRLTADFSMDGDAADIGYSSLFVRQPIVTIPRKFDGIDADWHMPLGAGLLRVKGLAGSAREKVLGPSATTPYDYHGTRLWGGFLEYARDGWVWRYAHGKVKLGRNGSGADFEGLLAALRQSAPNGEALADRLSLKGRLGDYHSVSIALDKGPMQLKAGANLLSLDNWLTQREFFLVGGYRIDSLTPYAAVAWQRYRGKPMSTGIPGGLSAAADALNAGGALAQRAGLPNQTDVILGVRYDFAPHKALKFQADHIRYRDPAVAIDRDWVSHAFDPGWRRAFTVFSVALDFVF